MLKRARSHQIASDAPEYVASWARDVFRVLGKRDVKRILDDLKAIADNKRVAKADRQIAAERVKALSQLLER